MTRLWGPTGAALRLFQADDGFLTFLREWDGRRAVCAADLTSEDRVVSVPEGDWGQDGHASFEGTLGDGVAELPPYQGRIALEQG